MSDLIQPTIQFFVIRVYGVLIDEMKRVLLSDELIRGKYYTKFPGGGLEFGEGTRECLVREFLEETGLKVTVGRHLYTTDYFQRSAFNDSQQIISIYYEVSADTSALKTKSHPFDFSEQQIANFNVQAEVLRWISLSELKENDVTLPIDKFVVTMLVDEFNRD